MKKRGLVRLIIVFFILTLFINLASALDCYGQKSGGDPDYYDICSCIDLQRMNEHLDWNYELINDIDCSITNPSDSDFDTNGPWKDGKGFLGIAYYDVSPYYGYKGIFNGNGKKIYDLYVNRPTVWGGALFYNFIGSIKNLGMERVNIVALSNAAGIASNGMYGSVISQCYTTGIITSLQWGDNARASGIVSFTDGLVNDCYSTAKVSSTNGFHDDNSVTGGLVGGIGPNGIINRGLAIGEVSGMEFTGALLGVCDEHNGICCSNSFWNSDTASGTHGKWNTSPWSACGTSKNTAQLKTKSTYINAGWSTDVWDITEGYYPKLKWETPACTNQCTPPGNKSCSGNSVQNCSDYNGDGCLELGGDVTCSGSTPNCNNGVCVQCSLDSHCNDTNLCNGIETCSALGICQVGTPLICNDSRTCTIDSCVNSIGCSFIPNNTLCNDDNPCTSNICSTTGPAPTGCSNTPIPGCTEATGAYWTNMVDGTLAIANLKDSVKLFTVGKNFNGNEITFTIYKRCSGLGCIPALFFGNSKIATVSENDKAFIIWKAGNKSGGTFEAGNYYFTASVIEPVSGTTITATSPDLVVSSPENNNPPVAKIKNPKTGEIYNTSDIIAFNQSSYDVDDFINYSWNFDDGKITKGWSFDYINYNTTHKYDSVGQKHILLNVMDGRGLSRDDFASILILEPNLNSRYVFANISIPTWNQVIPPMQDLDATGSFALEISARKATCLAGACPLFISGIPGNGFEGQIIGDRSYDNLNFSWKFDDGSTDVNVSGNPRLLGKLFGSNGIHIINLAVILNTGERGSTQVKVIVDPSLSPQGSSCQDGVFWQNGVSYITTLPDDKCTMMDGNPNTNCCRTDFSCQPNDSFAPNPPRYQCMLKPNTYCDTINSYNDYKDSTNCTADICGKCRQGCGGGIIRNICGDGTSITIPSSGCRCKWETGKCKQESINQLNILNEISLDGTCDTQVTSSSDCQDGLMKVTQNSNRIWNNIAEMYIPPGKIQGVINEDDAKIWLETNCPELSNLCFTGTRDIICGEGAVKLSFFNATNLIIALGIILLIYLIWFIIRKYKKKQTKSRKKRIN